jgi:diguanylate cyclase (GGDEF)-like protein
MFGNVSLVIFTAMLMQLVAAGAWSLSHWALSLPQRPTRYWATAALLGAASMALTLLRGPLPLPLAVPLGNVLTLASTLAYTHGMRVFLGVALRPREPLILLGLETALALVAAPVLDGPGVPMLVMGTSTCVLWSFARAAWDGVRALRQEFNARVAWSLTLPLWLMCAMVALRLAGAFSNGSQALHVETLLNVAVALLYLLAIALLHLAMAAMVVLRLMASLRSLSIRDPLTGLLNRAEWLRLLGEQHRWLGRFGDPFSVLLVDIDHFKRVNDTWGHAAGDAVLVATAQLLLGSVRSMDVVARLGGEEFVVLLPRSGQAEALVVAERLRESMAGSTHSWKQQGITVTVSVGLACATNPDETAQQLMERADAALYQAKHGGRNRVVAAAPAAAPALSAAG